MLSVSRKKTIRVIVFLFLVEFLTQFSSLMNVGMVVRAWAAGEGEAIGEAKSLPRQVRFSGALADAAGTPLTGAQGVTFSLYAEQTGGAPLWLETQNVEADAQGRYSVLLGSMREDGLPQDMFTSNEARWLGVQANQPGTVEQPRVLLVSVPYALKAADAETLGGKPVTAFLLAPSANSDSATSEAAATDGLPTASVAVANRLVKYTDGAGTMDSSNVTDDGTNVGIGSPSTGAKLHIAGSVPGTGITDLLSLSTTDGVLRSEVTARGLQFWRFNNGVSNVGQMAFATPGGSPGIVMWTGPTFDQNRFDIVNYGSQFSLGFSADAGGTGQVLNLKPGGNVGIGTTAPTAKLEVSNNSTTTGATGVFGSANGATGQTFGVEGLNVSTTTGAAGVFGTATAITGQIYGVQGNTSSTTDFTAGVIGNATGATGQTRGVVGNTSSTSNNAVGVIGTALASTGNTVGVRGATNSTTNSSAGVVGNANNTGTSIGPPSVGSGQVRGVQGNTNSMTDGAVGVLGTANNAGFAVGPPQVGFGRVYGVQGNTNSTAQGAAGVAGFANNPGTAAGPPQVGSGQVYGVSGTTNSTSNDAAGVAGFAFNEAGGVGVGNGQVYGVEGITNSNDDDAAGVYGSATATTGQTAGVLGDNDSTTDFATGVAGSAHGDTGWTFGVFGETSSSTDYAAGVAGASSDSGNTAGVVGVALSATASGGAFVNIPGTGKIISGLKGSGVDVDGRPITPFTEVFSVQSTGDVVATGTVTATAFAGGSGGVKLASGGAKPTCDSSTRGTIWATLTGSGIVNDNIEVCLWWGGAFIWRSIGGVE